SCKNATCGDSFVEAGVENCDPPGQNGCRANCTQGCTTSAQCNDNNACTVDSCDASLNCHNDPISCSDNNACTADSCNPTTGCSFAPITCDDGNVCTSDSCNPSTGCVFSAPDPCCVDPCCGDPCCGDPCCGNPCCVSPVLMP